MLSESMSGAIDILLVEDNPSDMQLTLHALKRSQISNRIWVVRDGAEALDFLFAEGAESPRVVLMDLRLPRVDGSEVLRAIRGDPRTRTIPVVTLTSSQQEQDIAHMYELGANSYVVKPVNFDEFTETIHQLGAYWMRLNQRTPVADLAPYPVAS
jgi:two-component system, response regulator